MKKYIVREGDTLWEISKSTGVRLNLLMAANPQVKDPEQLQPGSVIVIPELGKQATPGNAPTANPPAASVHQSGGMQMPSTYSQPHPIPGSASPQSQPGQSKAAQPHSPQEYYFGFVWPHVVRQGETWESISSRYRVSLEHLKQMNPDLRSQTLRAGHVVYVPSPATPPATPPVPAGTAGPVPSEKPAYPVMPGTVPAPKPAYPAMPGTVPAHKPAYPGTPGMAPSEMPPYPGMPGMAPSQMPPYPGMPGMAPSQMPPYPGMPVETPLQVPGVQEDSQGPHTHSPFRTTYPAKPSAIPYYSKHGFMEPVSAWYNDWEESSAWDLDDGTGRSFAGHD